MKNNNKVILLVALILNGLITNAQAVLNADGPGNTYELINSFFAPGYTAVETPDILLGNHTQFGRHIDEVWDTDQGKYVFRFMSHVISFLDNEPVAAKTDRTRVEMKTYASSPANMKGTLGETVQYKWRFKIPTGFQPTSNFTHIHQVKAVDGDEDLPIFTLTLRKGTPNKLELIYTLNNVSATSKLANPNMSLFEGIWVEATETVKAGTGTTGTYSIVIKNVSTNAVLLNYSNNSIQTIRPAGTLSDNIYYAANSFIRPKWGIYRSVLALSDMKDEELFFSDISVAEGSSLAVNDFDVPVKSIFLKATLIKNELELFISSIEKTNISVFNVQGKKVLSFDGNGDQKIDFSTFASGIYILKSNSGETVKFEKR